MNDIATLVATIGFPCVAAIAVGFFVKYMFDKYTTDIKEMQASHREESKQFADALNNNTIVLQKLCDKLDKESD